MMNNRRTGAGKVATKLFSSEGAIDAAISKTAELAVEMLSARQEMRLSAIAGQDALESVIATCTVLIQARRAIVASHKELSVVQGELGLAPMAFGGFVDKGPVAATLTLVESQAA